MPSLLYNPTLFEQILRLAIADYRLRHRDENETSAWVWLSYKLLCDDSYPGKWIRGDSPFNEGWFIKIVKLLAGSYRLETESDIYIFAKAAGEDYVGLLKGDWWENILARIRTNETLDEQYWAMPQNLQLLLGACGALPTLKSYELFVFTYLWGLSEEATLGSLLDLGVLGWVSKQGEVWHIRPQVLKYAQNLFEELPPRRKKWLSDWAKRALRSDVYRRRCLKLRTISYLFSSWRSHFTWREYPTYIFQRLLHPEEVSDLHTRGHHDRT